jgi:hypothetical protein
MQREAELVAVCISIGDQRSFGKYSSYRTGVTRMAEAGVVNKVQLALDYLIKWDYISISNNEEGP